MSAFFEHRTDSFIVLYEEVMTMKETTSLTDVGYNSKNQSYIKITIEMWALEQYILVVD